MVVLPQPITRRGILRSTGLAADLEWFWWVCGAQAAEEEKEEEKQTDRQPVGYSSQPAVAITSELGKANKRNEQVDRCGKKKKKEQGLRTNQTIVVEHNHDRNSRITVPRI